MIPVKGDQRTMRRVNRGAILDLLRREGRLSRAQLVERSGLSGAAITTVVGELIREGLLVEETRGASTGGRPPVLLAINPQTLIVVGIKLMSDHLTAVLTNISIKARARLDLPIADTRPATVVKAVRESVRDLLKQSGCERQAPVGIGLGMPGVIDFRRGVCVHSPMLGWRDVPIAGLIEKALRCPVMVDNDVNAFTEAERLFGRGRNSTNFIVVTVGRGIGAGLVINGRTYRGHRGGAGELGHVPLDQGERRCVCGNRGCLEAYASEPAMLDQLRRARVLAQPVSVEAMLAHAKAGHAPVLDVLRDGGSRLGTAIAGLANLFDPELIIVGGEGTRLGDAYFKPMRQSLRRHLFGPIGDGLQVAVEPWNDDAWARGAAGLVVGETFRSGLH